MRRAPRVELLHVPGCPRVDGVRATAEECLREAGIKAAVRERQGPFASPTLLVDGIDVVTGVAVQTPASCRLDLPTRSQILAAVERSES
jgi:hypothetical protein